MLSPIIISVLLGAVVLILFNWWTNSNENSSGSSSSGTGDDGTLSSSTEVETYTAIQVAEHAREDDAWIIVDGKVSDVNYGLVFYDSSSMNLSSYFSHLYLCLHWLHGYTASFYSYQGI
jgi:hypothetical protein